MPSFFRYALLAGVAAFMPHRLNAESTIQPTSNSNINQHSAVAAEGEKASAADEKSWDLFEWIHHLGQAPSDADDPNATPVKAVEAAHPAPPEIVVNDQAVKEAIAAASESKEQSKPLTGQVLELVRVQDYLNSLTTIVSDFTQVAPDGSLTTGKFYLERPGRMRWEYDPPTPILIITSGSNLVYYDSELQQVSHIPLDSTLASLLAREHIDLRDPKLAVKALTRAAGVLRITLSQKDKPEDGSLMLEFADQPLTIRNMVVTDAGRQVTSISLNKAQFGQPLEKSLFVWVDPRKRK